MELLHMHKHEKVVEHINVAYLVVNEDILSPLLRRQVTELIVKETELSGDSLRVTILLFQSIPSLVRRWRRLMILKKNLRKHCVTLTLIPNICPWPFPNLGFVKTDVGFRQNAIWNRFAARFFSVYAFPYLAYAYLIKKRRIFHSRSYPPAYAVTIFKRVFKSLKHVFDPRSDFPEENVVAGSWSEDSRDYMFWKSSEKEIIESSMYTACISRSYQTHFENTAGMFQSFIVPNNVDTERFQFSSKARYEKRSILGYSENDIVFVFLGDMSINGWHRPASYRKFFEKIIAVYPHAKLLMLVPPHANDSLSQVFNDLEGINIINPKYDDVADWLSSADYGLMYLHKRKIAVGTKIGEYLSLGLPVITNSNCLGTVSFLKEQPMAGIIYDVGLGDLDAAEQSTAEFCLNNFISRRELSSLARHVFDNKTIATQYLTIYKKLAALFNRIG